MIFESLLGPFDRYDYDDIGGIEEKHDCENDGRYFTKLLFEQSHLFRSFNTSHKVLKASNLLTSKRMSEVLKFNSVLCTKTNNY